jgi:hypothetical protein
MNLFREPLLHFLLAGALLFGAFAWLNRGEDASGDVDTTIRVTERELTWLAETWGRQWQRPPTDVELQGLVTDYLREELLAREARGLELDRDDIIVRRRLAQKMDFILEDTARLASPTEAELRARYDEDPARFSAPARVSFQSVFFSAEKRGDRAATDARAALTRLTSGASDPDPARLGDSTLLPDRMEAADEQEIAGVFGPDLARTVAGFAPGGWVGPVESEFGLHLVRVTERREPEVRTFEAVRTELEEEWRRRANESARQAYFKGLLERYDIAATDGVRSMIDPAVATLRGEPD